MMESPSHGIYLDWNATSPVHPEVAEAVMPFLRGEYGNPSAPYAPGRAARERIEAARAQTAALIGAAPEEIIFTSGGTESNNLAIKGACAARGKSPLAAHARRIVTSAVEHPSVIETCRWLARQGCELTVVPVDGAGRVDPRDIEAALRPDATLVSIMHANNETGTIEPVAGDRPALPRARNPLPRGRRPGGGKNRRGREGTRLRPVLDLRA